MRAFTTVYRDFVKEHLDLVGTLPQGAEGMLSSELTANIRQTHLKYADANEAWPELHNEILGYLKGVKRGKNYERDAYATLTYDTNRRGKTTLYVYFPHY